MADSHADRRETGKPERRDFLQLALMTAAGGSVLAVAGNGAAAQEPGTSAERRGLYPGGAPSADSGYSPGITAQGGRLIFVSGQGPAERTADMETQIRQTFDRIGLVLAEAGASFENVVLLRSYWVHLLRDLPIYRRVRKDYLVEPYPASTAIGVPELAFPDLMLEIEATAVV